MDGTEAKKNIPANELNTQVSPLQYKDPSELKASIDWMETCKKGKKNEKKSSSSENRCNIGNTSTDDNQLPNSLETIGFDLFLGQVFKVPLDGIRS